MRVQSLRLHTIPAAPSQPTRPLLPLFLIIMGVLLFSVDSVLRLLPAGGGAALAFLLLMEHFLSDDLLWGERIIWLTRWVPMMSALALAGGCLYMSAVALTMQRLTAIDTALIAVLLAISGFLSLVESILVDSAARVAR